MSEPHEPTWLSSSDLGELRALGHRRTLRSGSTVFLEGDDPAELLIVEAGDVKLTTTSLNGQEVVLDVLGAGDLLGELSAIDGSPRSASAVALTDVEVTTVAVDRFLAFLRQHPVAMGSLLAVVVRRLRLSNRRQLEFSTADALGRVCARLDEMATRLDGMMLELAKVFEDHVASGIKRLLTLLEPALILTMGFIIALIIISILMGILSVNDLAL